MSSDRQWTEIEDTDNELVEHLVWIAAVRDAQEHEPTDTLLEIARSQTALYDYMRKHGITARAVAEHVRDRLNRWIETRDFYVSLRAISKEETDDDR